MKKEEKIKELEKRQTELKEQFREIISQPISDDSIKDAETTGVDIISETMNNYIMLDILNWDDDTKLSDTALKFKKSKQK
jgi:putative N-acetylmannosamine-6-phosphate epimerase